MIYRLEFTKTVQNSATGQSNIQLSLHVDNLIEILRKRNGKVQSNQSCHNCSVQQAMTNNRGLERALD